MALIKKKKCCNCTEFFEPNPQNAKHQSYCSKPECRKASKDESQRRWLEKNPEYYRGPTHVKRVQEWRMDNPGYSRRQYKNRKNALQKSLNPENPTSELQEATEPENPTSALKESLESKKRTRALQEALELENRPSALQEPLEPENRNRALQEALEPENRTCALQEPLEPENRTCALQEALKPENRTLALQETSEPKKRANALQEISDQEKSTNALQDLWQPYLFENKENTLILQLNALQDSLAMQQAVLIGLIANITGSALQDSLDNTLRRMRDLGMDIVNNSNTLKGGAHDEKTSHPPGSYPQSSKAVQLGRSPTGP